MRTVPSYFTFKFAAAFAMLSAITSPARSEIRTVGAGCQHTTLQSALDYIDNLTGSHEIRIKKGTYLVPEGLTYTPQVNQGIVSLIGGFALCSDSAPSGDISVDANRAVFDGSGGAHKPTLDLDLQGRVGSFQLRRIVLTGGDAFSSDEYFNMGGGLVIRGAASVLVGTGMSLRSNTAGRGGGVALVGSPVNSGAPENAYKVDFYIDDGASITGNTALEEGGGVYCGGASVDLRTNSNRHGSITFVDGVISNNSAARGGAFYCFGSLEVGGGFQPHPKHNAAAWIIGNTANSCAAGSGTLDASIAAVEGYRPLGADADSNGMLAITNHTGDHPALCLYGSYTRGTNSIPADASNFWLRNFYLQNQQGSGTIGLSLSSQMNLKITPSGNTTNCSFFAPTPCVTLSNNNHDDTPILGGVTDALVMLSQSNIDLQRAKISDNNARSSLFYASSATVKISSSLILDNRIDNDGSMFWAVNFSDYKIVHSTAIGSSLARYFRLDGSTAVGQASIFAGTSFPGPSTTGGTSPLSAFTHRWCGFYANLNDYSFHTEVNDPTLGAFLALGPTALNLDASYAPITPSLRDACTIDSDVTIDFYGRPFGRRLDGVTPPYADIGAVEAQTIPDPIFTHSFEN
jgi:hypothetical protein